jgi:PAS domain S-box-containing protein
MAAGALGVLLAISFGGYVWTENQIARAHEQRNKSFLLAEELRDSSDELTKMVRLYVVIGIPIYKQYYQDILDIRNGQKPRPQGYGRIYRNSKPPASQPPRPHSAQTVSLLALMSQAGFSDAEFRALAEAKTQSDALTATEFTAMKLIEAPGLPAAASRAKALALVHDAKYLDAKAAIMKATDNFILLADQRTLAVVQSATRHAWVMRWLVIALSGALVWSLWQMRQTLHEILGGKLDQIHALTLQIRRGDFSTALAPSPAGRDTVRGWLEETQTALRVSQRGLATLAACNRALVRLDQEPELLQQICQIVVVQGGYRMACVGFAENDETKTVRIGASAGDEQDFLATAQINWSEEDERGRGPAGIAFRTGQMTVCNDFQTDPQTVPWRTEAARCGYASFISLPLEHADRIFGVIMIYSEQINAFTDEEITLLSTLADDLALGVNSLRTRQEQRQAEASREEALNRLQQIASHVPGVVFQFRLRADGSSGFPYASDGIREIYQVTPEEVRADASKVFAVLHPDDYDTIVASMRESAHQLTPWRLEYRVKHEDGTVRWLFGNALPHREAGGGTLWHGFITDITSRKLAEELLRKGELKFHAIIDASPVPLALNDERGNVIYLNGAFSRTFGYDRSDLPTLADWWPKAYPDPAYRQWVATNWMAKVEEARRTGIPFDPIEVKVRCRDGSDRIVLASAAGLGKGFQDLHLAVLYDITEHKQMEGTARANAERLAMATAASGVGIWEYDVVTNRLVWDDQMYHLYGTAREHFGAAYASWQNGIHPEDRQRSDQEAQRALRGETDFNTEFRVLWPDGSTHYLRSIGTVQRDATGNALRMIGTSWDITQQRLGEETQARLMLAIDQSAESIVFTDINGTILYVNQGFETASGYTRAEAIGQNPRVLKSGKHPGDYYKTMWETIMRGETWHGRFSNQRKDGTIYEEDATISPIRNSQGQITGFVAVKRDTTREALLERQLLEAQKMQAIGQLAGGVAHDFNNILAAFILQLDLLKGDSTLKPSVQDALQNLHNGAERAAGLTAQLLMFSRRKAVQKKLIELNALLEDELKMLRRLLGEHIDLSIRAQTGDAWLEADPGMIGQVVMNLCLNARDAMPKGGRLTVGISVLHLDSGQTRHIEARAGTFVCLSITDEGCGMDLPLQARIFEPFFTTKAIGKGTGLGLASVYGIVKQHEGWIELSSEVGKGSQFQVYLPAASPPTLVSAAATSPILYSGTETILLVEDEENLRKLVGVWLKAAGYQVFEAANGSEALKLWSDRIGQLDLLVTDMVMPGGMNGLELAEEFKKLKPQLPVIILSGYSNDLLPDRVAYRTDLTFLGKPCKTQVLNATLRRLLDQAKNQPRSD